MNIDLKSLNEIELDELDLENIGSWPLAVKIIVCIIAAGLVAFFTYSMMVSSEIEAYEQAQQKEQELRTTYRQKYDVASKLEIYRQQMVEMEEKFAQLLKRLPTSSETPGLIEDLSYIGTSSGLTFHKVEWMPEIEKEFYTELPIKIEVVGSYHDFGEFVSKVAELPRIISLHDFTITGGDKQEQLEFSVVAKTYRYEGERE
ncbi:type 4a pilus biogenesis protein PilO [Pseudoalteromonas sp. G4]|jgi:type IV pilus assembly protein PilO|uniref:type 4a pilus biogenesis protein PilO n=1 Tax=Pseudoalteromonas sp. G4 TaxID=2992761 RepID=UPI00237DC660|nr:type 4a pilus biogenesis protein PilO [Pseudoalteromonas sp. G4]MDE3273835.1 type 4a pilus biogenesis protein PilO [Pseudoalteromonas sp. G4]